MNREEKDIFEKTSQRLVNDIHNQDEINSSWNVIEKQTRRSFLSRHKILLSLATTAAAIVAIFVLSIYYTSSQKPDSLSLSLLNDIESFGNEIVLIADNKQIELAHESTLEYNDNGHITSIADSLNQEKENQSEDKEEIKYNRIVVPKGKRISVTFSDGTLMCVNSGSQVVYPSVFNKNTREVLVQGEIYLDVAKDKNRPFIVKTEQLEVKVLGTSFNVSAYHEDFETSVVLVEGSVEVKNKDQAPIQIKPNQRVTLSNSVFDLQTVDVTKYIAWTDDIMVVDNLNCGEILKKVSRYYGVEIHYSKELNDIHTGGELNLKNGIDDVMKNLSFSFNLNYHVNKDGSITVTMK